MIILLQALHNFFRVILNNTEQYIDNMSIHSTFFIEVSGMRLMLLHWGSFNFENSGNLRISHDKIHY